MQKLHNNNFDFIRLMAAISVWYGHCYALLLAKDPLGVASNNIEGFGSLGVAIFFIISGYFITASYDSRRKILSFLKSRVLRIFPPLIIVVLLSVFVVGTIFTTDNIKDYLSNSETIHYLNTMLALPIHYNLPGVFKTNPVEAVNGSLWTIKREVKLYMLIAMLGWLGILRPRLLTILLISVYCLRLANLIDVSDYIKIPEKLKDMQLESLFIGGSFLYVARDKIKLNITLFLLSLSFLIVSFYIKNALNVIIFEFSLTYIVIYLGFAKLPLLSNLSKYGDFSYGFYLYAFPIQQIFIHIMGKGLNFTLFLFASFFSTLLCAVLSWHFIEKPALAYKN